MISTVAAHLATWLGYLLGGLIIVVIFSLMVAVLVLMLRVLARLWRFIVGNRPAPRTGPRSTSSPAPGPASGVALRQWRQGWPAYRDMAVPLSGGSVPLWRLELDCFRMALAAAWRGDEAGRRVGERNREAYDRAAIEGRDARPLSRLAAAFGSLAGRLRPVPVRDRLSRKRWWLKIYRVRDEPVFTLIAWYRRPAGRSVKRNFLWGFIALAFAFYKWDDPSEPYNLMPRLALLFAFLMVPVGFGAARLRLTVSPRGIRWRDAGGKRRSVDPAEMNGAEIVVLPEHSEADAERQTDLLNGKQTYPVYRNASEVMMHSGYRLMTSQQVVEIARDRGGWQAKQIQAAVHATVEAFGEDIAKRMNRAAISSQTLD